LLLIRAEIHVKTDVLCYQVLQAIPQTYFEAIGAPASTAAGYTFASEELKQAGLRVDGVFLPTRQQDPIHFVEVFFYKTPHAYSNLFAKVFLWLETKNPAKDWHACLIFAGRKLEPRQIHPYRALLASDQVKVIYLDELPAGNEQLGLGILKMIASPPEQAAEMARQWLTRLATREKSVAVRRKGA
jgi:predicted transposase YdaD